MLRITMAALALCGLALAGPAGAASDERPLRLAQGGACGWYVILGCSREWRGAEATLRDLGGPGVGGLAGAHVIHTNDYPNFRNGWFCVADGPYAERWQAAEIAWTEAVPDAYVKNGC